MALFNQFLSELSLEGGDQHENEGEGTIVTAHLKNNMKITGVL